MTIEKILNSFRIAVRDCFKISSNAYPRVQVKEEANRQWTLDLAIGAYRLINFNKAKNYA